MLGKWTLIYFGFTNCPDICPEELDKMGGAVNALGTSGLCVSFGFGSLTCAAEKRYGTAIQPVFISVDPPRDTPARIASYLLIPSQIDRTHGTYQDTKAVCKAYRVYFQHRQRKADDDYLVDHSIFFYFMDPDGQFVDAFGKDTSMEAVVARVEKEIENGKGRQVEDVHFCWRHVYYICNKYYHNSCIASGVGFGLAGCMPMRSAGDKVVYWSLRLGKLPL